VIKKNVVVITQDMVAANLIHRFLSPTYHIVLFSGLQSALDYIYNSMPDLVISDVNKDDPVSANILNDVKEDPIFSQLPVIALLPDDFEVSQWDALLVEDYLRKTDIERDLRGRVGLSIARSARIVEINPLTRLPGNISINRQIQLRLTREEVFALAYADLDHFKPFNDYYGFGRGDEVIKMAGRLILNIVKNRQAHDSFVGHIGGDDFIFICSVDSAESISMEIIDAFDRITPTFYDRNERECGSIQAPDRQGHLSTFPIISLSIGITNNHHSRFSHYGEITEAASEMKKLAKGVKGSCCKIDKRQNPAQT
jgi:diguanylate cyclase (GGDEF)-like protein